MKSFYIFIFLLCLATGCTDTAPPNYCHKGITHTVLENYPDSGLTSIVTGGVAWQNDRYPPTIYFEIIKYRGESIDKIRFKKTCAEFNQRNK